VDGFFDEAGRQLSGDGPGVLLRQVSPTQFSLEESFSYRNGDTTILVDKATLRASDLASVPWYMTWFLNRYGRHTLAALLHDSLVAGVANTCDARRSADRVFFEALKPLGVPLLLRLIMWIAVTLETRWNSTDQLRALRRLGLIGWSVAALWGIGNFIANLTWWDLGPLGQWLIDLAPFGWSGIWISFLLPVIAAPLWGRDAWPQGAVAVVPGFFVVPVSLFAAIATAIYRVLEQIASLFDS
jgi:hypothetical protein